MSKLLKLLIRWCTGFVIVAILVNILKAQETVFPAAEWEKATPESQCIDGTKLASAMNYLVNLYASAGPGGIIVIRNGYNIWSTNNIDKSYNLYSAGKLWYTLAAGKMIEEGYFGMDSPAKNWEPLLATCDEYRDITLKHLFTFTSGYDAVNPVHKDKWGNIEDDWSATPFNPAGPAFAPGSAFLYWDDAVHMLARVITGELGQSIESYIRPKIMEPIGLTHYTWDNISDVFPDYSEDKINGDEIGAIGVYTSASQLARMGHLLLNKGNWQGKQILREDFVKEATTNQVPVKIPLFKDINTDENFILGHHGDLDGRGISGYMLWINGIDSQGSRHLPDAPESTYYANGGWSVLFVIPEWNMVIARTGRKQPQGGVVPVYNEVIRRIGESLNL